MSDLSDYQIRDFCDATASTDAAPGAGSAAAVALALGLACARKAIAITLKHRPDAPDLAALDTYLAGLSDQALAGGAADMARFSDYIAAMRRPEDEPDRGDAERDALTDLVAIDESLVAIGDAARQRVLAVRGDIHPTMASDVAAALALLAAARGIHAACAAESVETLNP